MTLDYALFGIGAPGLALLWHVSPFPLPKFKPFTCAICLSSWIAIVLATTKLLLEQRVADIPSAMASVGIATMLSAILIWSLPQFWRPS